MVIAPPLKIYSFDVFDTCVTRTFAHPRDLFFDLGWKLAPRNLDNRAHRHFAAKFQRARIRAEKIANWRARPGREHADIYAVYANFHHLLHTGLTTEQLVLAEIELEADSIFAVHRNVQRIDSLRKDGHKIIFLSDMYIPARLLEPILRRLKIMKGDDFLYVSCDVGAGKRSGKLFEHVLQAEGVDAKQVVHTGDNTQADIWMAQKYGITAEHFTSAWLSRSEQFVAGRKLPRQPAESWLAAFSRRVRLENHPTPTKITQVLDEVIHSVIVPFLLAYVLWVIDDARKRRIKRLYFVARDGEVLYKIAQRLSPRDIDIRYLHGSRRAWLAPSITPTTMEWKRLLVVAGNASRPRDIAARIGLDFSSQDRLRCCLGINCDAWKSPLALDDANLFVDNLLSNSAAAELIATSSSEKRRVALSYFQQEGLFDEVPWALVDAGWSLNSQSALKRILAHGGQTCQVPRGYYLGLAADHLDVAQAGEAYAFVTPANSLFSRRRVIVEHCFLPACHASTEDYQLNGGRTLPVFSNEVRGEAELAYAHRLHEVADRAANLAADQATVRDSLKSYTPKIVANAANFIRHPSDRDADALRGFGTIADLRHEVAFTEPLCRSLTLRDAWKTLTMTLSKGRTFKSPAYMWLEGSMALSPRHVRVPLELMLWLDDFRSKFKAEC